MGGFFFILNFPFLVPTIWNDKVLRFKKKTPVHLLVSKFILFFNSKLCTFHCKQSCRSKHLLKQFWRRNVMKIMHSEHYILIYRQIIFTAKLKNCFQVKVAIKILPHRLSNHMLVVHPIDKAEVLTWSWTSRILIFRFWNKWSRCFWSVKHTCAWNF